MACKRQIGEHLRSSRESITWPGLKSTNNWHCRYTAGEPKNLPDLNFGPNGVNLGGILAWEFLLMHWVEVRRWQDYRVPGSVNQVCAGQQFSHTTRLMKQRIES